MEGHHHHHQHQHQHHQYTGAGGLHGVDTGGGGGGGGDRFPQWSIQETRDFLMIRAELDPTFMETKRNKLLWEVLATRMREKGYNRSSDQCKCKWKNLVTRYKGCETMESEGMRQQFPFYNELQAIFAARMQRMLYMEAEGTTSSAAVTATATASGSKKKPASSSEEEDDEESEGDQQQQHHKQQQQQEVNINIKKKRKKNINNKGGFSSNDQNNNSLIIIREMLEEFMKQQVQMEMQWLQEQEVREEERRKREMEWKQKMEALENERLIMERRWREREEQRRIRDEARADKRDALITALLNKLSREEDLHHHHL